MISRFNRESRGEESREERRRYRSLAYISRVVARRGPTTSGNLLTLDGDQRRARLLSRDASRLECPADCRYLAAIERRLRLSPDSVKLSRRVRRELVSTRDRPETFTCKEGIVHFEHALRYL